MTAVPAAPLATVVDLDARRRAGELALVRRAQQPVLHVTPEFLAALNCRDAEAPRRRLRAV